MADQLNTPVFRVSFPTLWVPKPYQNKPPQFSVVHLWPKDTDLSSLKAAARKAAIEKFGEKLPPNLKSPFRDGSEKAHLDGYGPGIIFMRSSSGEDKQPKILYGPKLEPVLDRSKIYAGCYCDAIVSPWVYDHKDSGSKGVSFNLLAIRFVRDGEAFGGGNADMDLFEELPEDAFGGGEAAPAAIDGDDFLS